MLAAFAALPAYAQTGSTKPNVLVIWGDDIGAWKKSQHNSNTYNDWFLDRVLVLAPMQGLAARFLKTMVDYPPSQKPGSFNLTNVMEQIEASMGGRRADTSSTLSLGRARAVTSHSCV